MLQDTKWYLTFLKKVISNLSLFTIVLIYGVSDMKKNPLTPKREKFQEQRKIVQIDQRRFQILSFFRFSDHRLGLRN